MRDTAESSSRELARPDGALRFPQEEDDVVWTVDIIEEAGRFVVRTKVGEDIHDTHFTIEGFAHLYARGQRVHFQTLSELAADKTDGALQGAEIAALIGLDGKAAETAEAIRPKATEKPSKRPNRKMSRG